jgi:hypothetical protein
MSVTTAIRRAVLETFPAGTPLTVVAPQSAEFSRLLGERNDAAIGVSDLGAVATSQGLIDPAIPHVLLEGLDDLDEPIAFLATLRREAPQTRVFALIANSAHVGALGAFYSGVPLAAGHPLVHEDLEPLFQAAGWRMLTIKTFADESIPPAEALPFVANVGQIVFSLSERDMLERCRCAAFLAIADPA